MDRLLASFTGRLNPVHQTEIPRAAGQGGYSDFDPTVRQRSQPQHSFSHVFLDGVYALGEESPVFRRVRPPTRSIWVRRRCYLSKLATRVYIAGERLQCSSYLYVNQMYGF